MLPPRILAFVVLLCALAPDALAARQQLPPERVKLNELVGDTQKSSASPKLVDLVWWIPPQFWSTVLVKDGNAQLKKEVDELFSKYTVVAVVRGNVGTFGIDKYATENELRKELLLAGPDGTNYHPVSAELVDPRLNTLIQMLKPVFSNMLGQMGSNVNFFAFPGADASGKPVANPLADGNLKVTMGELQYVFRLPLGSLLEPQLDAKTGEVFPGSYEFNPYTGARLQTATQQQ